MRPPLRMHVRVRRRYRNCVLRDAFRDRPFACALFPLMPTIRVVPFLPLAFSASLAMALCSCSSSSDCSDPPRTHATFRLTVDAEGLPLPHDLRIIVHSGSGFEEYDLAAPNQAPQLVFCTVDSGEVGSADASDDQNTPPDAGSLEVVCDLWTDGAATVEVKASGYPDTTTNISPDMNQCGVVLTAEHIELEQAD